MSHYFSLEGEINRFLHSEDQSYERKPNFRSSDMGKCFRMRYYKRSGEVPMENDSRTLRIFAVGKQVHEMIQEILEKQGLLVAKEADMDHDQFMFGHFDALVNPFANGVERIFPLERRGENFILYDIKTVNSKKFHYLKNQGSFSDPHYIRQLHSYCMMIRKHGYTLLFKDGVQVYKRGEGVEERKFPPLPGLKDCRIFYVSKDDLMIREIGVPFDEAGEALVMKEIVTLRHHWETQEIPEAVPQAEWECNYCPFRHICPRGQQILAGQLQKSTKETFKL